MKTERPVAEARSHLPAADDFLLWPPALQVWGYRRVDQLFASRPVGKAVTPRPIPRGDELDVAYGADGATKTTADFLDRNRIAGLLVMHRGAIRLERYALGLQSGDRWSTMSTVKSITGMLVGAAVQDGHLRLDQPASRYVEELAGSAYDEVTIGHLLTMCSGVRWSEDYADPSSDVNRYSRSLAQKVPGGVLQMMRGLPRAHPPGARWLYNTGDTYVLGVALSRACGKPLATLLGEKFWQPCGMEFDAFYTLESPGGAEIGGSRAGVALRDFGRFAQFVLEDGMVNGTRLLPQGWVDASARPAFLIDEVGYALLPRLRSGRIRGYGYSWWVDEEGAMVANGFAGQRIYINRAEQLVVVTLAAFPQKAYTGPAEHDHYREVTVFTDAVRALL